MHKTEAVIIEDLITELKNLIWSETVSLDIYGTSKEDAFLSGINEGIDRAYRVLADFNYSGYAIREEQK